MMNCINRSALCHYGFGLWSLPLLLAAWSQPAQPQTRCRNSSAALEVRQSVEAMNRSQQAYFLEHQRFAKTLPELQSGLLEKTQCYQYLTRQQGMQAIQYGIPLQPYGYTPTYFLGIRIGETRKLLPTYVGVAVLPSDRLTAANNANNIVPISILCYSPRPLQIEEIPLPIAQQGQLSCPPGMQKVGR